MLPRCSFVQQVSQAPLHIYITLSNIYLNYLHYKTTDSLYIKYSIIVLDSNLSSESLIILNLSGRYLSFIVYLCFNSLKLSLHLASIGIVRPSLQTTPLKLHVFHALLSRQSLFSLRYLLTVFVVCVRLYKITTSTLNPHSGL